MEQPSPAPRTARRSGRNRVTDGIGRVVFWVIWLAVAVAIALGAAGVAAALDHRPGTPARPELTWSRDSAVAPELDAATEELRAIGALTDELGLQGRGALAALAARDFPLLDRTVVAGSLLVQEIETRSEALTRRLAALEGFGPGADFVLSSASQERHERLVAGARTPLGLSASWARLTQGAVAAGRLSTLLNTHDERITTAIDVGRQGDFDLAIERIDEASAALDEAGRLRDQLAPTTDVATLDEWLRRNREYDVAIRRLYEVSSTTPDRVTPELREALRAETEAREQLPRTTSGLSIVMADIARGGLNQAVISIEETRGRVAEALEPPAPADEEIGTDGVPAP